MAHLGRRRFVLYTVIRFCDSENRDELLTSLGSALNEVRPGSFTEIDRRREHRFCCSIIDGGLWDDHREAINQFVAQCGAVIDRATRSGIELQIDTALEGEDRREVVVQSILIDCEFMQQLVTREISLVMSVYP